MGDPWGIRSCHLHVRRDAVPLPISSADGTLHSTIRNCHLKGLIHGIGPAWVGCTRCNFTDDLCAFPFLKKERKPFPTRERSR